LILKHLSILFALRPGKIITNQESCKALSILFALRPGETAEALYEYANFQSSLH